MIGSLWALARPAGMPLVLGLPAVGYGYAHWEWGLPAHDPVGFAWVLVAWWLLSAGTLWLNAALDHDENEVLMGPAGRVEVPDAITGWAYGALASAVVAAALAGAAPALITGACAAMAVGYSHPATAWKGHPALGPLVNVLGYGVLSPLAGFAVVGAPPTPRTAVTAALLACWIGATYFVAQAHQEDDDRKRGYRTLVATHGAEAAIGMSRALYAVAIWGLAGFALAGLYPAGIALALGPWWLLDRWLVAWRGRGAGGARTMLRRAVGIALTVMVATGVQHVWQVLDGRPPAGLGTPWHPE